jgi:ribonuclease HI
MKKSKQKELVRKYQQEQFQSLSKANDLITCYFDGATEPINPGGNMGIGATIRKDGIELFRNSGFIKANELNSNNVAEYLAFESILDFFLAKNIQSETIYIFGDSKLVINQMSGMWKIRFGLYVTSAKRCWDKLQKLKRQKKVFLFWIPRDENHYADELSKAELINHNVQFRIQPLSKNPAQ